MLAGEPVDLSGLSIFPYARLTGIDSDSPQLQLLGYDGQPLRCGDFAFTPRAAPQARYAELLAMVAVEAPGPADMAAAGAAMRDLPPAAMLPVLDQQTTPQAVRDGLAAMEQRLAETDPARFCVVIEAQRSSRHTVREDALLQIASGVPLAHWTRPLTEAGLAMAQACEDNTYAEILARLWPQIEARIAGMDQLRATIATLAATPVTLEGYRASGWLRADPLALRDSGLAGPDIAAIVTPARARILDAAVPVLVQELAQGVAEATDPMALLRHCADGLAADSGLADAAPLQRLTLACEEIAAPHLARAARDHLAAEAQRTGATDSFDAAVAARGYAILPDLARPPVSHAFAPVLADLAPQIRAAEEGLDDRRARILAAEEARLRAAFAAFDPASGDPAALPSCYYPIN